MLIHDGDDMMRLMRVAVRLGLRTGGCTPGVAHGWRVYRWDCSWCHKVSVTPLWQGECRYSMDCIVWTVCGVTGNQLHDSWMVSSGLTVNYRVFIARGGVGLCHGCGRAHCGIADPTIDRCHGCAPSAVPLVASRGSIVYHEYGSSAAHRMGTVATFLDR